MSSNGSGSSGGSSSSTTSTAGKSAPHVLMKKGKRGTAAYIHAACSSATTTSTSTTSGGPPSQGQQLNDLLDLLLHPRESITEWETIEWCKWLMAGGRTPDEFTSIVRTYDNATTCGLVWTPNFVAYRCRTCGISPCMSLCTECFKKGNHHRHDFNMFLSQAGGACDCGDTSVMKETGFCDRHGPNKTINKSAAPGDLMCVAEAMMPRIIFRLIQHMRENSKNPSPDAHKVAIRDAEAYITMLLDFNNMGALMRRVMTSALTNPQQYRLLTVIPDTNEVTSEQHAYALESKRLYDEAVNSLPNPEPPDEYTNCAPLQQQLVHKTFLEELVFWTVKLEFPQKVVCLLLNMLPDPDYKEDLTRAFVLHYSRIAQMLERSADPDTLSNRVVHVSVQLFSNEALALRMADEMQLLHIMVVSLRHMMSKILVQNTLHDADKNFHLAVDCAQRVMKDHCYWPLVSDLNNVLSHRPIALRFMGDDALLEMWFTFLQMFQGMNVNWRELTQHIEFEPNTYYAAFSAELEASAYPMWALASHLIDEGTSQLTRRVVAACVTSLLEWLDAVCFTGPQCDDGLRVSFHLPLHRYLAVFVCQAVRLQNLTPDELLPSPDQLQLIMMHPLRVQVAFYEILNGLWVRNGLQIKGQAMTYIQCNFCNSMVDADLYLLQLCSTRVPRDWFLNTVIDKFGTRQLLTLAPTINTQNNTTDPNTNETQTNNSTSPGIFTNGPQPMLDSFLTFLATLLAVRTNLGLSDLELNRLEMVTLLCMGDKTHSQLMELMPERCGTSQSRDFEQLLTSVADYRAPNLEASGNMQQGMYAPKQEVWKSRYDPLHVLLRSVHRRDFQTSMDRYAEWARQSGRTRTGGAPPWPPYRRPAPCSPQYDDPCSLLDSKVFHACALAVLMKSARGNASEHATSLIVHLLELAVERSSVDMEGFSKKESKTAIQTNKQENSEKVVNDKELASWFDDDCLPINLRTTISFTVVIPESPDRSPITYSSSDSDVEWGDSDSSDDDSIPNSPNPPVINTSTVSNDLRALLAPPNIEESTGMEIAIAEPIAIDDFSMTVATMDVEIADEAITIETAENRPALPPPTQRPAVLAGNEVGRQPLEDEIFDETPYAVRPMQSTSSKHRAKRKQQTQTKNPEEKPKEQHVPVNESIISLLLRLHSQLSGVPDSYNPDSPFDQEDDSRCGDGPYHVSRLPHRIEQLDEVCAEHVRECRKKIWPPRPDAEKEQRRRESLEREDRRRRAKERQQRLMEEFANRQRQFLETMETEENASNSRKKEDDAMDWEEEERPPCAAATNYDCVICGQTTTSTEDKPMGLVVLVQATSVLGHRRRVNNESSEVESENLGDFEKDRPPLPTCAEERAELQRYTTMSADFSRRFEEFDRHFDRNTHDSWLLALNIGWEGGVHVQTCGHHLHLDCLRSYLESLRTQQRLQSLAVDKGEYFCPLCRQLANSVLPLPPELGTEKAAVVRARTSSSSGASTSRNIEANDGRELRAAADELLDMLRDARPQPPGAQLGKAIGKAMEDMTNSTHMKTLPGQQSPMSLYLFIASIARTNIEVELVQRGGTLVSPNPNDVPSSSNSQTPIVLTPKRDCIVPLLHVLAVHVRLVAQWSHWITWEQLYGRLDSECSPSPVASQRPLAVLGPTDIDSTTNACVPSPSQSSRWNENPTPLMYRDPVALLIKFTLLLPLHMDQVYFTTIVRLLYNLLYYQVVAQLTTSMTTGEKAAVKKAAEKPGERGLAIALARVFEALSGTDIYGEDSTTRNLEEQEEETKVNLNALEQRVQQLCLPFLRCAALLRHHLYGQPLPEVRAIECEFVRVVYYLELVTDGMDWELFSAAAALRWPDADAGLSCTYFWLGQLREFASRSQIAARSLLAEQHVLWRPPRLLRLPREYEKIFTYYHERQCTQCHSVPPETSVCLLCGRVVCLKHSCCKQGSVCEAVAHSLDCGAGTGLFLVVTSTYIIVIRGRRACLWGSLYLDDFEEEDRDLKRGKPLYLSKDRFQLLEQQWLAHRFDHTKKTWVWHRDAL